MGEVTAFFDYSPGRPGRNYMPNGDPGYPDEPPELDVFCIRLGTSEIDTQHLSDFIQEQLIAGVEAHLESIWEAEHAERAERERDYP